MRAISIGTWSRTQATNHVPSLLTLENIAHHKAVEHEGHMWVFGGN